MRARAYCVHSVGHEFFLGSENEVVKCSATQLKRNMTDGHSRNLGNTFLTDSVHFGDRSASGGGGGSALHASHSQVEQTDRCQVLFSADVREDCSSDQTALNLATSRRSFCSTPNPFPNVAPSVRDFLAFHPRPCPVRSFDFFSSLSTTSLCVKARKSVSVSEVVREVTYR